MDLRTALTISALLLMTAESEQTTPQPNANSSTTQTNSKSSACTCPSAAQTATAAPTLGSNSSAPALGLLKIEWEGGCKGYLKLVLYPSASAFHVCNDSLTKVKSLIGDVCHNKKGCTGKPDWKKHSQKQTGYDIKDTGPEERTSCVTLRFLCSVEVVPNVQGQLQACKVVIALLCCGLLVLLLIRFTRPTVKALQKRLSDRRQKRWIGPTQSHSVSYHRGKSAVHSNDGEKRLSYPALERLTVSDSREPSSNRNSDYNF